MLRYALIDANGSVVNVVGWDGESDWQPPKGLRAIRDKLGEAEPEGRFDGKAFQPRVKPAPEPKELGPTERLAELEARQAAFEKKVAELEARIPEVERKKTETLKVSSAKRP